jgi:hypothetical protein
LCSPTPACLPTNPCLCVCHCLPVTCMLAACCGLLFLLHPCWLPACPPIPLARAVFIMHTHGSSTASWTAPDRLQTPPPPSLPCHSRSRSPALEACPHRSPLSHAFPLAAGTQKRLLSSPARLHALPPQHTASSPKQAPRARMAPAAPGNRPPASYTPRPASSLAGTSAQRPWRGLGPLVGPRRRRCCCCCSLASGYTPQHPSTAASGAAAASGRYCCCHSRGLRRPAVRPSAGRLLAPGLQCVHHHRTWRVGVPLAAGSSDGW